MKISRVQSLFAAGGILVVFFVITISVVKQRDADQVQQKGAAALTAEAADSKKVLGGKEKRSVGFVLNNFHRSQIKNGKKIWEVIATRGKYFPETNEAKLAEAKLWLFKDSGETTTLTAERATLTLEGASLLEAKVVGNIEIVHNDKITINTKKALYNKQKNTVHAPGKVNISSELFDVSGDELVANIETQEFTLKRDVSSVIKPKNEVPD